MIAPAVLPDAASGWACEQGLLRLFQRLDQRHYDGVVALFAPDGEWHRQGRRHAGYDEIRAMLHTRSETAVVRHVVSNIVVDALDAERWVASSYVIGYLHDTGAPAALPVAIDSALRFFEARTEFRLVSGAMLIGRHAMEPVLEFQSREGKR